MAIPSTYKVMRSGIVGTIADDGPRRVKKVILGVDPANEKLATPSRAACYVDTTSEVVEPGGDGKFAGIILGNERVLSDVGDSWYAKGDGIEVMQMGAVFVNIDNHADNPSSAAARGGKVYYETATGKLFAAVGTGGAVGVEIPDAYIESIDDGSKPTRLAKIVLNGPRP